MTTSLNRMDERLGSLHPFKLIRDSSWMWYFKGWTFHFLEDRVLCLWKSFSSTVHSPPPVAPHRTADSIVLMIICSTLLGEKGFPEIPLKTPFFVSGSHLWHLGCSGTFSVAVRMERGIGVRGVVIRDTACVCLIAVGPYIFTTSTGEKPGVTP